MHLQAVASAPGRIEQSHTASGVGLVPRAVLTAGQDPTEGFPLKQVFALGQLRRVSLERWRFELHVDHVPLAPVAEYRRAVDLLSCRRLDDDAVA